MDGIGSKTTKQKGRGWEPIERYGKLKGNPKMHHWQWHCSFSATSNASLKLLLESFLDYSLQHILLRLQRCCRKTHFAEQNALECAQPSAFSPTARAGCGDTTTNRGCQPGNLLNSGGKTCPRKKAGHLFQCEAFSFIFRLSLGTVVKQLSLNA